MTENTDKTHSETNNFAPVFKGLALVGVTGKDMAAALRLSTASISKWRNGHTVMPDEARAGARGFRRAPRKASAEANEGEHGKPLPPDSSASILQPSDGGRLTPCTLGCAVCRLDLLWRWP